MTTESGEASLKLSGYERVNKGVGPVTHCAVDSAGI